MDRFWPLLLLALILSGCGVAETGATAAASAESAAQQAVQAQTTEQHVREQVDAAFTQAAEQRRAAERDGQ